MWYNATATSKMTHLVLSELSPPFPIGILDLSPEGAGVPLTSPAFSFKFPSSFQQLSITLTGYHYFDSKYVMKMKLNKLMSETFF